MFAKFTRQAAAGLSVLAVAIASASAQAPTRAEVYRAAVALYVKTSDPLTAVKLLAGWEQKGLSDAVAETIKSGDVRVNEAAALLHLEIAVAIAGVSTGSTQTYLDLGSQLIDGITPTNPDVVRNLSREQLSQIAKVRATWHGVAGSAFLSVNDIDRARQFLSKAQKITPGSAAILTLQGTADEIEGAGYNPDDVESSMLSRRAVAQRTRLLLSAEELYRRALSADPAYALAQIRLGRVEYLFKNMKAAAQSLQKGSAAAQDPSHRYLAAMFTGAFLQEQKDLAGARAEFERALELAPRSQNAIVALAYVELIAGRPDRAQALVRGHLGTADPDEAWWAFKNGTLDLTGLRWLRQQVRK
jgi:tetratricopeptide (TPR) repeat protein